MAIDVTPIQSMRPAFLRLTPSILDAARPQLEPVGYNQRYGFIGPPNTLQQTNETSPSYLRTFVGAPSQADLLNEPLSVGTLGVEELVRSRTALQPQAQQLGLFGGSETGDVLPEGRAQPGLGLGSGGVAQYSAIQASESRPAIEHVSLNV